MLVAVVLAVAGLALGSFVNALVWRLHEQQELGGRKGKKLKAALQELSIMHGRSMCSHCRHRLAPVDLIPVISWVLLGGKCRYCRYRIQDNPLIELLVPALFLLSYLVWPNELHGFGWVQFCFWLAFVVGFVALALYDVRWYILPDRIVFPLISLAILQVGIHAVFFDGGWQSLLTAFWGVAISSGIFYVLFQVSKGTWIGGGDVKLGVVLGLLLGGPFRGLLLLFLASAFGVLASLPLLATGKARRGTLIPFGPFLLAAAITIMLFGDHFVNWLNRFIG